MTEPTDKPLPDAGEFWTRWIAVTFGGALIPFLLVLSWIAVLLMAQAPEGVLEIV
jgi:hypothetical protein